MKKNRIVKSFEPDEDVGEMLQPAIEGGLVLTEIVNRCLRTCGEDVIGQMAAEKLEKITKERERLKELSFEDPQVLLPGIAA